MGRLPAVSPIRIASLIALLAVLAGLSCPAARTVLTGLSGTAARTVLAGLSGLVARTALAAEKPAPRAARPAPPLIIIDIGHSPSRAGATSARGRPEYDFNRDLAADLAARLNATGLVRAALLIPDGRDLKPAERALLAGKMGADVLFSVHHDSVQPHYLESWTVDGATRRHCDLYSGHSLFYSARNARASDSLALARAIGRELKAAGLVYTRHHAEPIKGENRELVDAEVGIYRYDGLAVLGRAAMPAVLLEGGIIVNRDEELALSGPRRAVLAQAAADGVVAWLRESGRLGKPRLERIAPAGTGQREGP